MKCAIQLKRKAELRLLAKSVGCRSSVVISIRCLSDSSADVSSPPVRSIGKVLIANRGEIACRVIRTARKLGIKSVAVFSDADANSLHVHMADEAVHIGPATSSLSYLNYEKILEVSRLLGVDAIHPGYGFLSESVEFADACSKQGVVFIGPPTSAIRDMGIKSISKAIMSEAGVPIIPGYHGEDQSVERLRQEAAKIGYPVMLKAVRGGGGKGMRIVQCESEFVAMLESAKSEARKAFANDEMLIEKFVVKPRHVEVQVLCDLWGNGVHLFERDCSVQRRHQKIIEEAPAPGVPRDVAMQLGEVAVKAAKAVNYVGAGTVEFVMDSELNFFFMEMNTRLQVEHPITEMITGQDLVEWQFKVAEGSKLPLTRDQLKVNGHSFEARIYAEDPDNNFMPGAGVLKRLVAPTPVENEVRIETGVTEGDEVTVHYDPLIAKLVVWSQDRNLALRKLASCLDTYQILGLKTNIGFLKSLATHESFVRGEVNTDFIPDNYDSLFPSREMSKERVLHNICKACLALILNRRIHAPKSGSAWDLLKNFRVNSEAVETFKLKLSSGEDVLSPKVTFKRNGDFAVEMNNETIICQLLTSATDLQSLDTLKSIRCRIGDQLVSFGADLTGDVVSILPHGSSEIVEFKVEPVQKISSGDEASTASTEKAAVAPMTGIIDKILVKVGDVIKKNDPLVIMTAMKMEYTIKAPRSGIVECVLFGSGETVDRHAVIVEIAETDNQIDKDSNTTTTTTTTTTTVT